MITPSERRLYGRIGALTVHASGRTNTSAARQKFAQRFLDEVDPDRVLPVAERERRAGYARQRYFAALALKSAQARRQRAR